MRKISIAAAVCFGPLAFAAPSQSAPLSAAGSLGSEASRAAMNQVTTDEVATPVRYHGRVYSRPHYGWNRGHHYGWRNRYVHPRYSPRNYGYYGPRRYGYGGPGIQLYW